MQQPCLVLKMHLQTRNMRPTLALPVRGVQHMRIDLQLAANPPGKKLGFVGCRPLAVDGASGTMAAADASHGPGAPAPPRSVLRSDRTPDLHRQTQRHSFNIETGGHGGSWSVHHAQGPHSQNPFSRRDVCHPPCMPCPQVSSTRAASTDGRAQASQTHLRKKSSMLG